MHSKFVGHSTEIIWQSKINGPQGPLGLPVVAVVVEMEVAVETAHIGFVVAVVEPLFGC